ncbi:MAG: phenylalanine--tRNA ligase beta subunit-related protein [Patescibacteria group bacterium]|nr:hypothetical protein [Patescibacteria group bacterium]
MNFKISCQILQNYENLVIGVLAVKNIDNSGSDPEITTLLREAEKCVRETPGIEPVNSYPKIESWREAHKKFGSNPKKAAPSVQAIVRRVVKGGQLPNINKLVDLYNAISLKYVITAGGEDLDKCVGDIQLAYADGSEEFVELGATENNPPEPGEVVYKDDNGVICRKFNWREADRTKLTEETKNAVLVLEGLPPVTREEIEQALQELKELVEKYCGGEVESIILDKNNTSCGS